MNNLLIDALHDEIKFIENILAYASDESLVLLTNISEADTQAKSYYGCWREDLPAGLNDASIMMIVWNKVVTEEKLRRAKRLRMDSERKIMKDHPDWLTFTGYYDDPDEIAFIDPADIEHLLKFHGCMDEAHRKIVLDAIKAWSDRR